VSRGLIAGYIGDLEGESLLFQCLHRQEGLSHHSAGSEHQGVLPGLQGLNLADGEFGVGLDAPAARSAG
jgi:hypothetical protein